MAATGGDGTAARGPNTYVIMGHGIESLTDFEDRPTLADGYTLVTMAECGRVTDYDTVLSFLQEFLNPSKASNLQAPTTIMNPKYRIYRAGDKIPVLKVRLFLNMEEKADGFNFMKSGIYKVGDTELKDWILTPSAPAITAPYEQEKYLRKIVTQGPAKKIRKTMIESEIIPTYEKSLVLTSDKIAAAVSAMPQEFVYYDQLVGMKIWEVSLADILTALGPGVYYWPVCRGVTDYYDVASYVKAMKESMGDSFNATRYVPYTKDHRNFNFTEDERTAVLRLLQENMNNPAIPGWAKSGEVTTAKGELMGAKPKKVGLIRSLSGKQQQRLADSLTVVAESNSNLRGGSFRHRRKTRQRKRVAKRRATRRH